MPLIIFCTKSWSTPKTAPRELAKYQEACVLSDQAAAAQVYLQIFTVQKHLFLGGDPGTGLAARTINWRGGELGRLAGLEGVSPHDIRHYWATYSKGDVGALQQVGGWTNPYMALKHWVENAIANEGLTVPGQE